ncbi:MAG: hypothetical protein K2G55_05290 [Lachnospiraceae bacterium]|nr:hypothetical protein [Lachnospiraceae bacterium]MDE7201164.1 hypothetical protein [Lachnospiraceae bacterium]
MEEIELMQQGVDSRAMFATFIIKLPKLFILAVAGAILGSGLNLFVVLVKLQNRCYVSETEYYVAFDKGQDDARHWYNDFTWNDVLATDGILGRAMELLGDGYERSQVSEMLKADILSDVRYLTITVKGQDAAQVEEIKDAIGTALNEFGVAKEEFSSIEKIEDQGIVQEEIPYFAWRAAFLGAVIAAGIGIFVTAFCFCMGSVFYTKGDIMLRLGIPAYGMTFREGHRNKGSSTMEQGQAKKLEAGLKRLTEKYSRILLMDASDGQEAALLQQEILDRGLPDASYFQIYDAEKDIKLFGQENTVVVAVIPFGKSYRERIADEIDYVRLHGGRVAAAVLTGADRTWMRIYYAHAVHTPMRM